MAKIDWDKDRRKALGRKAPYTKPKWASQAQLDFLAVLGWEVPEGERLSRSDASFYIDVLKARRDGRHVEYVPPHLKEKL